MYNISPEIGIRSQSRTSSVCTFDPSLLPEPLSTPSRTGVVPVQPVTTPTKDTSNAATEDSVFGKPLPQLPTIIHAVSTLDESALPLRTAPLPRVPGTLADVPEEESLPSMTIARKQRLPLSHRASLRHMQSFPSSKSLGRSGSMSSDKLATSSHAKDIVDVEAQSANTVVVGSPDPSVQPTNPGTAKQVPIGVVDIHINDWEDAIDSAWENDQTHDQGKEEDYLVVVQPAYDQASSSSSTPLMISIAKQPCSSKEAEEPMPSPTVGHFQPVIDRVDESSPLLGLGIDPYGPVPSMNLDVELSLAGANAPAFETVKMNQRPSLPYRAESSISKSSSQDSISLSVASSIVGTPRSSSSSTNFSDFAHITKFEELSRKQEEAWNELDSCSLSGLEMEIQRASSQETVRDDTAVPTATSNPRILPYQRLENIVGPASPERNPWMVQVPVSPRTSSIRGADASLSRVTRKRSSTTGNRPRHSVRASYSLFPISQAIATS